MIMMTTIKMHLGIETCSTFQIQIDVESIVNLSVIRCKYVPKCTVRSVSILVAVFEHPVFNEFFIPSYNLGILQSLQVDSRQYLSHVGDLLSPDPLDKLRPSDKTFRSRIVCSLTFSSNVPGGGLQRCRGISDCGHQGGATILPWETGPIFAPALCTREKNMNFVPGKKTHEF